MGNGGSRLVWMRWKNVEEITKAVLLLWVESGEWGIAAEQGKIKKAIEIYHLCKYVLVGTFPNDVLSCGSLHPILLLQHLFVVFNCWKMVVPTRVLIFPSIKSLMMTSNDGIRYMKLVFIGFFVSREPHHTSSFLIYNFLTKKLQNVKFAML